MTTQEEMALNGTREGLDLTLGKISSPEEWSGIETGIPGSCRITIPGSVQKVGGCSTWGHGLVENTMALG